MQGGGVTFVPPLHKFMHKQYDENNATGCRITWAHVLTDAVPAVRGGLCGAVYRGPTVSLRAQGPQRLNVDQCGAERSAPQCLSVSLCVMLLSLER